MGDNLKDQMINEMLNNKKLGHSTADFFLDQLIQLKKENQIFSAQLKNMQRQLDKSELFFSLPEINLHSANKLETIHLTAEDCVSIDSNFYEVEFHGDKALRWMGPNRLTTFKLPINRTTEKHLRIKLYSAIKEDLWASLKLYIDGEPADYTREESSESIEILSTLKPSPTLQDTIVGLFVPVLYKPSDINPESNDHRLISFTFRGLEVL